MTLPTKRLVFIFTAIVFVLGVLLYIWFVQSEPYEIAEHYARNEPRIKTVLGNNLKTSLSPSRMGIGGLLFGKRTATLVVAIKGDKGKGWMHSELVKTDDGWVLNEATLDSPQAPEAVILKEPNVK